MLVFAKLGGGWVNSNATLNLPDTVWLAVASNTLQVALDRQTRVCFGTRSPSVPVPVITTTEAVMPARSLMLSGTSSMRTITGMRCASRIYSNVGWTEGNCSNPVQPFCWAVP
jgi:hypothetical protein